MSNCWRSDRFYGEPWVRVAGPIATALYQAAEDYCHRELSAATVPIAELGILLPWPMRPGELDGAIEILERLGRFVRDLDSVTLPRYHVEQEADEAQKSAHARRVSGGRARAEGAKRDALGRMTKTQQDPSCQLVGSSSPLENSGGDPASVSSVRPSVTSVLSLTGAGASLPACGEKGPRASSDNPPKPKKPKKEPHPKRKDYLAEFHQAHKTATGGSVYSWDWRAFSALDRACEDYPEDRWKAACAGYASRRPEWLFRDGCVPDLHGMIRNFNAFAAAAAASAPRQANGRLSPMAFLTVGLKPNGQ